jgi:hypothetical protein
MMVAHVVCGQVIFPTTVDGLFGFRNVQGFAEDKFPPRATPTLNQAVPKQKEAVPSKA